MDGLEPTGRELKDPAARVLEAVDGDGRHYTVIAFDAGHVGHNALTLNVRLVQSFMEYPMVTGLVELGKSDPEQGWFAYPTGSVWTLFDVLRAYGDYGQVVGMRGALELAWLVGQILVEAGDTGPMQGCFSHGNLSPWRITLRADGLVQVIGYGIPQVEVIRHRAGDGPGLTVASYAYCPPERLEGVPEDASADTYSLALMTYELITGKSVYGTHDVAELERMVGLSEAANVLSRGDAGLPPKVAKLLARALIYDPDARLSGAAFVEAIGGLLANEALAGPSLSEIVDTLKGRQRQGAPAGRRLTQAATAAYTPQELAAAAGASDDDETPAGADPRWQKVARGRRPPADDPPPTPAPAAPPPSDAARRLRRSEAAPVPLSRRRRRGAPDDEESTDVGSSTADAADPGPIPASVADAAPEPPPVVAATEAALEGRRVRRPPEPEEAEPVRRRRPVDDDEDGAPRRRPRD